MSGKTPSSSGSSAPVAMISYSHDSPAHKDWVRSFAERLTRDGIKVVLDQWHLALGDELPRFMEESISTADYVLLICTEIYVKKANDRAGGVGYESSLVAAQLLTQPQIAAKGPTRIIPVVRQANHYPELPRFVAGRYYANLSDNGSDTGSAYEELVRTLHGTPKHEPPPLGTNPYRRTLRQPATEGIAPRPEPTAGAAGSGEVLKALKAARRLGSQELGARRPTFPLIQHVTPEGRADELLTILQTHDRYFQGLVFATLRGEFAMRRLGQEIEDVMSLPDWPQSGPLRIVRLPSVLSWAAHRLIGALLVWQGRASLAVDLARESVTWEAGPRKLILIPELIGWPVVPGNSREAWDATRGWPAAFPWITEVFGDEDEFWIAMNAHLMVLNFAEFLERASSGPSFDQIRVGREFAPRVPLYFWREPEAVARRAYRLVTDDALGLGERIGIAIHLEMGDLWEQWLTFQRGWLGLESDHAAASSKPPHEGLLQAALGASSS